MHQGRWLLVGLVLVLGVAVEWPGQSTLGSAPQSPAVHVRTAASEWGEIKGQVVFGGDAVPKVADKNVTSDKDHCLKDGPIRGDAWQVNPKNKGLRYVVVFLKFESDGEVPIHRDLAKPAKPEVVIDQPVCRFEPHVLAMRANQKLRVLNPAPIAHNIKIQGFEADFNRQIAPGKETTFQLRAEDNPISLSCGAHPWMGGYLWVFDHPYFAVTDADGNFSIAKAPAGDQKLVLWYEEVGYVGGADGRVIAIKANAETDLGKFEVVPKKK